MDATKQNSPKQEEKKDNKKILYVLIALLSVLCIVLGGLYFNERGKLATETKEKIVYLDKSNDLQSELASLKEDYQSLETNDLAVRQQLDDKIAQIEQLEKEAAKHKNDAYIIGKLKKEAATLRSIMKGYITTIDSLNTLNQTITAEKQKVESDLNSEKGKSAMLNKEKEDLQGVVAIGSRFTAVNIKATGVRFKSGGKKEDETKKAKRVEKIKVAFNIAANKISKKGPHDIFVRIMTPDGKELAQSMGQDNVFSFNGSKGYYAGKQTVDYNNQEMAVSILCQAAGGVFVPGKYIVELYSDGGDIGQTTLVLE